MSILESIRNFFMPDKNRRPRNEINNTMTDGSVSGSLFNDTGQYGSSYDSSSATPEIIPDHHDHPDHSGFHGFHSDMNPSDSTMNDSVPDSFDSGGWDGGGDSGGSDSGGGDGGGGE